jgi:hypothetical protein
MSGNGIGLENAKDAGMSEQFFNRARMTHHPCSNEASTIVAISGTHSSEKFVIYIRADGNSSAERSVHRFLQFLGIL